MSQELENERIFKKLQEVVDFGIEVNQKALRVGQTLYLDIDLKIPPEVAEAFVQKYKQAGWRRIRIYADKTEADKTVIELAKGQWSSLFRWIFDR